MLLIVSSFTLFHGTLKNFLPLRSKLWLIHKEFPLNDADILFIQRRVSLSPRNLFVQIANIPNKFFLELLAHNFFKLLFKQLLQFIKFLPFGEGWDILEWADTYPIVKCRQLKCYFLRNVFRSSLLYRLIVLGRGW